MAHFLSFFETFWLVAAYWVEYGGSEYALWASLLPAVYPVSRPLLRT